MRAAAWSWMVSAAIVACIGWPAAVRAHVFQDSAPQPSTANQDVAVKADYLSKFAPFVTWPEIETKAVGPFTICVVGEDPFGDQISQAVAGQAIDTPSGPRAIEVVHVETIGAKSDCAIAYLGGSRTESVGEALRAVRGTPTLTVTDEGNPPGIISFTVTEGHVRFRIDQVQARENGLVISSKLLDLALSVRALPAEGTP